MKRIHRITMLFCIAVAVLLVVVACTPTSDEDVQLTSITTPDTTTPETTTPDTTTPEATTPDTTTPEATTPEATTPEVTTPDGTIAPEITTPEETTPAETTPEQIVPQEPILCGDALSSYVIVYDEQASDYTVRAALYIAEQIRVRTGVALPTVPIGASNITNPHEIVVGETVRPISQSLDADTEGFEFALLADDDHIALEGDHFIIAAAAYYFVETYIPGAVFDTDVSQTVSICTPIVKKAENFILLIGDGMGFNQTKLFDAYADRPISDDYSDGEDCFYGYLFPYIGEAKTNSLSGTTDSAAAGTALASGYKTVNGYIGKDGNLNDVLSLTELAAAVDKATAVMSTEGQTGATPASFSAHANSRNDGNAILASQAELVAQYGTIIDCSYNFYTEAEMVALRAAITRTLNALSEDEDGFFVMYEEAYIDKHCHNNNAAEAYLAMLRFNQAIALFMEYAFYNPDTMVIITADHETGGLQIAANGDFYYTSGSHTSANVPVFAYGADCAVFDGAVIENTQIPKTIAALFGIKIEGSNPVQHPALVPIEQES